MKVYTTKSPFNCGPCSFINLTGLKGTKKLEMELSKEKLKPFKASSYASFLAWSSKHKKDLMIYTSKKTITPKMFELMISYEKIPEKLQKKYKKKALKRFDDLNKKYSEKVKLLRDPMGKLDNLIEKGCVVNILSSSFFFRDNNPVPHWIVCYGKKEGEYNIMCSRKGKIKLTKRDILKGFELNKKLGYYPVLIAYKR